MSATTVADAKITQDQLIQIRDMLDKDGDGKVTADEFKVPWMKLFPKLTPDDFKEVWKQIDKDGDGNMSMDELAKYYGYDLNKKDEDQGEMSDEKILEALQLQAQLAEMEEERKKREQEKEEAAQKKLSGGRKTSSGARDKHRSSSGVVSVKMPGKVTQSTDDENVIFMQSCDLGDVNAIKKKMDADPKFTGRIEDDKGEMALHKLSRFPFQDMKDVIREFLTRSAKNETAANDLNWQDKTGKTPLFYAAEYGNSELALLFLDKGADPFVKDNNGSTVLHCAAQMDKLEVARDILKHHKISPADGSTATKKQLINDTDKSGRTALHIAAYKSKEGEMVQMLLNHGADATKEDSNCNTASKLANKTGRRKSKELLDEAMMAAK